MFVKDFLISNLTPVFFVLFFTFIIKNIKRNYEFIILAISPLLIYWFFYLNGQNQAFNYGGFCFHLYTFTVPFFLSYTVSWLSGKNGFINATVLGSYIVFMAFNLYYISGNFNIIMKCASWIVRGLFWAILATYIVLSLLLLGYGVGKKKKTKLFNKIKNV